MANDKIMVENGQSMRRIMKATRAEAKLSRLMARQSQEMAEGMRQDSISMKTVSYQTVHPGYACLSHVSRLHYSQWDFSPGLLLR